VSVITAFSFTGIMLGVATLIIVMSVMNGFREELFSRILGINGHMNVYAISGPLQQYEPLRAKLMDIDGVKSITPIIESPRLRLVILWALRIIISRLVRCWRVN